MWDVIFRGITHGPWHTAHDGKRQQKVAHAHYLPKISIIFWGFRVCPFLAKKRKVIGFSGSVKKRKKKKRKVFVNVNGPTLYLQFYGEPHRWLNDIRIVYTMYWAWVAFKHVWKRTVLCRSMLFHYKLCQGGSLCEHFKKSFCGKHTKAHLWSTCTVRAPVFGRHQFFGTSEHYGKAHGILLYGWMNYNYTACCWFSTSSNILILPSQFWQIRFESCWLHCSKCRILVRYGTHLVCFALYP